VAARPSEIVDFETDKMEVEQEGTPGKSVTGEYSWTAPNGEEYGVKYVADAGGFRVLENDAVAVFRDAGLPADVGGEGDDDVSDSESGTDDGEEAEQENDVEDEDEDEDDDAEDEDDHAEDEDSNED